MKTKIISALNKSIRLPLGCDPLGGDLKADLGRDIFMGRMGCGPLGVKFCGWSCFKL